MVALTTDRNTPEAAGDVRELPMLANVVAFAGALAVIDAAGFLRPAITALNLKAVGRFEARANNTGGANGAITGKAKRGIFRFANSAAGDLIANTDIDADCFIVDDQTVAKTNGANTRSVAGKVHMVDASGVWVRVGGV